MHLNQGVEGVWIENIPLQQWIINEPSIATTTLDRMQFLSKSEVAILSETQKKALKELDPSHLYPLGIAREVDADYMILIWNAGYLFRRKATLSSSPLFHIPLKFTSRHINPRINQLLCPFNAQRYDPETLDHLAFALLHSGDLQRALRVAITLCEKDPDVEKGWLRLGDISFKMGCYKLAMLAYGHLLHLTMASQKLITYSVERVTACSEHTEWGHLFLAEERIQIPTSLSSILLEPWTSGRQVLQDAQTDIPPTLKLDMHARVLVPTGATQQFAALPRGFRWMMPFQIALSSAPTSEDEITVLLSSPVGIRHIITLDGESAPMKSWLYGKPVKNTLVPVPDYHPPSVEQVDCIMELLTDPSSLPALVHCRAGFGRTGTIAACYIAAFGFQSPTDDESMPVMQASQAINALRAIRPGSVETAEQEELVAQWVNTVWKRKSILPLAVQEPPPCSLEPFGTLPADADLLVLVGLQGSGKSWFARALRARAPARWKRVSQDESGSRSTCEREIGRDPFGKRVILDRCNPDGKDRAYWVKLAHWAKHPVLVWFDYQSDVCIARAQKRLDHPTLPPGSRVRTAISSTAAQFESPPLENPEKEGFSGIAVVRSFKACLELVSLFSPPIQLFKFPRTPHLLDLGAATEDDLHHSPSGSQAPATIRLDNDSKMIVCEKIDGANLGISLSEDSQIIVQNRSHWVNSKTHFQFKRLDLWVEENREGLHRILARDDVFPQRYVLFGEWMVCVHSIRYSQLPSQFLAFDLYDRSTGTFASRDDMEHVLEGTGIHMVPVLEIREATHNSPLVMPTDEELRAMVQQQSKFYEGRVEGIYMKVEKEGKVTGRGKVVRGDFIAGNEHWTRGNLALNGILTAHSSA